MAVLFRRQTLALTRREVLIGVGLGVLYGLAQLLQTIGLEHTAASVSGFVTGTYVVLTPVLGAVLLRDRIGRTTWVAVAARHRRAGRAVAARALGRLRRGAHPGLGGRSTPCTSSGSAGTRPPASATGLATVQAVVIAVVALVAARARRASPCPRPAASGPRCSTWPLVAGAVALWAQTWAQSHLPATRAAIVMTMEPVFAAFFAVLFGGESLTGRMLVGGATGPRRDVRRRAAAARPAPATPQREDGPARPSCCTTSV